MSRPALLVALLVLAGCVGAPGPVSPTDRGADGRTADSATATDAATVTPRQSVRVHYVLEAEGDALDEFRSVTTGSDGSVTTGSDGSVTVAVESARVFEIRVPVNASSA